MIMLLALFAAFGLWRTTMVLRRGTADRSTGAILLVTAPLLAAPIILLAWLGEERDIQVSIADAWMAGTLGAVCVVSGVVLLVARKRRAG
jgi:hypothetical protein